GEVARIVRRPVSGLLVLRTEALERGPRLEQRAVHGEMLGRKKPPVLRRLADPLEEQAGDVGFEQPRLVLGERRGIEGVLVESQVEEEAKEEIVLQALAELPLAAHAVERDEQAALKQHLGRDRGPTPLTVHRV